MSFFSSHCSLVFVLSERAKHVPAHASVWKPWVKMTCFFSALLSYCLFYHTLLSFCLCVASLMLWYYPLGKFSWQFGRSPSESEPLSNTRKSSDHKYKPLGLQWFRLCWCFSFLISYREKSLEMQNCLWVVVAEKGKILKWKTQIRSVNMYLNWWNLRMS